MGSMKEGVLIPDILVKRSDSDLDNYDRLNEKQKEGQSI
jgi:hypothetical protein